VKINLIAAARQQISYLNIKQNLRSAVFQTLTAAMDGFLSSPAAGWVTSAPKNITGSVLRKDGLESSTNTKHLIG